MRRKRLWRTVRAFSLVLALVLVLIGSGTPIAKAVPAQQFAVNWFFAEGSTDSPFDTWFLVENPGSTAASVQFTFMFPNSVNIVQTYTVGPTSRFSLFANQVLPAGGFSTRISSNSMIFAERSMYVGYDGHLVAGIGAPGTRWLFAEGSTNAPFDTWLLLQNPNPTAAAAQITYFLAAGAPVVQTVTLPPVSRTSIYVNAVIPNQGFSTQVISTAPIVAERAMYRFPGNAGTGVSGTNNPNVKWMFAEGDTRANTDTWLLLGNPNPGAVDVNVSLLTDAGGVLTIPFSVAPTSRLSIFLNAFLPNSTFGITLEASAPIVAERAMYLGTEPRGAHATQGANAPTTVWQFAEGSTNAPFTEIITVLNTNVEPTTSLRFEFFKPDGTVAVVETSIGPLRRFTLNVNDVVPNAGVSARVSGSRPIVVEQTMLINKLGSLGANNTIGIPSP